MTDGLQIEMFPLSDWMTNCYVVADASSKACWIVDAGYEPQAMLRFVEEGGLSVEKVVLTHAHLDHIGGLQEVHDAHPEAPILIHEAERGFLTDTTLNLSAFLGMPTVAPEATGFLRPGGTLALGRHAFEIRHTPGHSPGGVTLYSAENAAALVGDALFAGSVGRTDFPTSDPDVLRRSIQTQLYTLPDETRVYPGHGPQTTIGRERRSNPFVRG